MKIEVCELRNAIHCTATAAVSYEAHRVNWCRSDGSSCSTGYTNVLVVVTRWILTSRSKLDQGHERVRTSHESHPLCLSHDVSSSKYSSTPYYPKGKERRQRSTPLVSGDDVTTSCSLDDHGVRHMQYWQYPTFVLQRFGSTRDMLLLVLLNDTRTPRNSS